MAERQRVQGVIRRDSPQKHRGFVHHNNLTTAGEVIDDGPDPSQPGACAGRENMPDDLALHPCDGVRLPPQLVAVQSEINRRVLLRGDGKIREGGVLNDGDLRVFLPDKLHHGQNWVRVAGDLLREGIHVEGHGDADDLVGLDVPVAGERLRPMPAEAAGRLVIRRHDDAANRPADDWLQFLGHRPVLGAEYVDEKRA